MVSLLLAVTLVQRVEQGRVNQCAGPDHTCWPNDKLAKQATECKAHGLGSKVEEDLVSEARVLAVEDLLSGKNIGSVRANDSDIAHDCDANVLFDVEWSRV